MYRKMSVCGSFYPSKAKYIEDLIKEFNHQSTTKQKINQNILAAIVPHAGYIYSGFSANEIYKTLPSKKRVIVIGPSHRFSYEGISGSFFKKFETPFGDLDIDLHYLNLLKNSFDIDFYPIFHQEHSTEVQMPFIKYYLKDSSIIELIYSKFDYIKLSEMITYLLKDSNNLVLVSTDLSHFHSLKEANELDENCMKGIEKKDIILLNKCEACGKVGIKALIKSVNELHLQTKIITYTTSAKKSFDNRNVVGYLGAIIEK